MYEDLEEDPKLRRILRSATKLAEAELSSTPQGPGYCHLFWQTKKRILKEKFNIDWLTPAEKNPDIRFD